MATARPAGIKTTHALRGSLGPNAPVTSRIGQLLPGVGQECVAGRGLAEVAWQGQRRADPLVEMEGMIDGHRGVEPARPAEDGDQGGNQRAQSPGDGERMPNPAPAKVD